MIPETKSSRIMLVDDDGVNLKVLCAMLSTSGFNNLVSIQDPRTVLDLYRQGRTDLILLDLNMPYMDGYQVMAELKALKDPLLPPIIVLTAQRGREFLLRAFESGARDFLTKPFDLPELLARVGTLLELHLAHRFIYEQNERLDTLVRKRTEELLRTRLQVVQKLGRASEFRDNETGKHIIRVSLISALLAEKSGWDRDSCETLLHAAPMHDVGKIGIPDSILLRPGKLEPPEWEIMKRHTFIGAHILEGEDSELLRMATEIALTHHEKWDGSGYPKGLAGTAIPQAGRIVALADVFDALTSHRPYKDAWGVDEAMKLIAEHRGTHFDPDLVDLFEASMPEILAIRDAHADEL